MKFRCACRAASAWLFLAASVARAQAPPPAPAAALYPPPKVPLAFNRLYDYPALVDALRALVQGHPDVLSLKSLGKSVEGRDLWCVTINDPSTGNEHSKPAMYVDGNVHGNEIQGAEAALYLVWYLAENRGRAPEIRELIRERVFYVVPTINPDGRAYWFQGPNTTHSSRSGKSPRDDDRDGLVDEDGYDDLDGDGQVTMMRRRNPHGRFKADPADPRALVPVKPGETGEFDLLGHEGLDNDGDGRVNEDPPGGYDMNRNWPSDWKPDHQQSGAGDFPLCWPETRAVGEFLVDHPNIAGVQSFHNAAGMILRGPGHPSRQGEYPAEDDFVAAEIGRVGERMIPFYKSLVLHKDLYHVHGGFVTWTFEHLGIVSFTNELWNTDQLLGRPAAAGTPPPIGNATENDLLFANDKLLFGMAFVPWKPFHHPLYGDIEIGGFVKQSERVPPTFLIEELCHRNAAFVAYHARQMPLVEWDAVTVASLGPDLFSITASVRNTRLIPTMTAPSTRRRLGLPDMLTLVGPDLTVLSGGLLVNPDTGEVEAVEHVPATIRLPRGVSVDAPARVRWFVRGKGQATVRYASQKAKGLQTVVELTVKPQ